MECKGERIGERSRDLGATLRTGTNDVSGKRDVVRDWPSVTGVTRERLLGPEL
jgi:hypothetical protein